jgi:hypothetical protein
MNDVALGTSCLGLLNRTGAPTHVFAAALSNVS